MPNTESNLIPVVDYVRASTDKAKDEHTVRDQQTVNEQTAARLGCRIVARFKDNDKSAAKENVIRDDFETMLNVLRAGRLDDGTLVMGCIVVADDRLIRRAGDYERFVDAITYDEGRVYADNRGFKDLYSEDVESMGLMGAVISRMEVKKTRRRVRQWHRSRAEKGIAPGGPRPFGWQDDKAALNHDESTLIRQAVEAIIAGRSIHSVVTDWQRKGIKTPRGNAWTANPFRKMIRNPRLCGWRMISGELVRDSDGAPIVGTWEPIITPVQWQAIQAIFDQRKGKHVSSSGAVLHTLPQDSRELRHLLSGILRCGRILEDGAMCGAKMRIHQSRSGQLSYSCPPKTLGGCRGISRQAAKVDEFVSEAVLAKLEERMVAPRQKEAPWPKQHELNEKVEQLKELRAQWGKRKVSNNVFFEELERLEPEIAQLRAEKERHSLAVAQAAQDFTDIRRRWYSENDEDRLDLSQKRAYIRQALHTVIVHPQGKGHGRAFDPDLLDPIWRED